MSSAALTRPLRTLFAEMEQLFETETESRVSYRVQAAERALAEHLNQAVRRLRQAEGFSTMAGVLCDASAPFARACAVFQVNDGTAVLEQVRGGVRDTGEPQPGNLQLEIKNAAAFVGAIESGEPLAAICSIAEVSAAVVELFGHSPDEKAFLFPLIVDGNTTGVFYAGGAVSTAALELLAQTAAAFLEARRSARRAMPMGGAGLLQIEPAAADGCSQHPPDQAAPEKAAPDWDSLSLADRSLHLRAQRFARVQVAEIRLYRPDDIKTGRANGDLYSALQDAIDEGREDFRQNFVASSRTMVDYFHLELVRTLANDTPALLGGNYPGPMVVHG